MIIGHHDKVKDDNLSIERLIFNFEIDEEEGEIKRTKELEVKEIDAPYYPGEK